MMSFLSSRLLAQECNIAPFPIVFGGSLAGIYLYKIDYHSGTERLAAVGDNHDYATRGDTVLNVWRAYIIVY